VPSDSLAPPPKQAIAEGVYALDNEWKKIRVLFTGETTVEAAEALRVNGAQLLQAADTLTTRYVDEAWAADTTVPGTKIMMANIQKTRIMKMAADVVLYYMNPQLSELGYVQVDPEEMVAQMGVFETQQLILTNGRKGRRLVDDDYVPLKTDVSPSTDPMVVKMLEDAESSWTALKAISHLKGLRASQNPSKRYVRLWKPQMP
jgi:hypothetical protein